MPSSPPPDLARALEAHRSGRTGEADAAYREILAREPGSADAWHMHGVLALQSGDAALAIERILTALELVPNDAVAWTNLGNARTRAEAWQASADAFGRATELAPTLVEAWLGLGGALRMLDALEGAIDAYHEAVAIQPDRVEAHNGLGIALKEDGLLDDAARAYRRALEIEPDNSAIHVNLGHALGDAGQHDEALRVYERALEIAPNSADVHYALFAARYSDDRPTQAEDHLRKALSGNPEHHRARYALAVLCTLCEDAEQAISHAAHLSGDLEFLRDSLRYLDTNRTATTRFFTDSFRLLTHALGEAHVDGLVLELGVRRGTSINHLASQCAGPLYGFDAFEGLPSSWGPRAPGAYSTRGQRPAVPSHVTLIDGWFRDTLPTFAKRHPGPIRLLNVDCDLYVSTVEAFEVLGPRLVPGSVIVFDELLENPGWQSEEHKALLEAAKRFNFSYEHIAFGISTKQVAIRVTRSSQRDNRARL